MKNLLLLHRDNLTFPNFNAVYIGVTWLGNGDTQEKSVERMWNEYQSHKANGHTIFLIQFGYGLGDFDNNYFYKVIFRKFKDCSDVIFYIGEFYEEFAETGKFSPTQVEAIVFERMLLTKYNLIWDATARNKINIGANSLSSYFHQTKFWRTTDKFAWIYGQFAWHSCIPFIGSSSYKRLAKRINELGIKNVGLYQGDSNIWAWSKPYTWGTWLQSKLGIQDWYEALQRKRFLKYFG